MKNGIKYFVLFVFLVVDIHGYNIKKREKATASSEVEDEFLVHKLHKKKQKKNPYTAQIIDLLNVEAQFNEEEGTMGDDQGENDLKQNIEDTTLKNLNEILSENSPTSGLAKAKPLPKMTSNNYNGPNDLEDNSESRQKSGKKNKKITSKKKLPENKSSSKNEENEKKSENMENDDDHAKTDIVKETEKQPTESWMIKLATPGELKKIENIKREKSKAKSVHKPTKAKQIQFISTHTIPSKNPTIISETPITTKSSRIFTVTPSPKSTPEPVSTHSVINDNINDSIYDYSGSGSNSDDLSTGPRTSKNKTNFAKKTKKSSQKVSAVQNSKYNSTTKPTNTLTTFTPVYDDNDIQTFGSGEDNNSTDSATNSLEARSNEKDTEKRVLCVGDSITEGYYERGAAFHPYTKKLGELLNADNSKITYRVYNEGKSGECVYPEMANRLPLLIQKYKPLNLVIILGGTNDVYQKCEKGRLFNTIKNMHKIVHKEGIKTVAITIPDSNIPANSENNTAEKTWGNVNDLIREYSKGKDNVILCDLAEELPFRTMDEEERKKFWDDDLHYTPLGYDRMAEIIYDDIQGNF